MSLCFIICARQTDRARETGCGGCCVWHESTAVALRSHTMDMRSSDWSNVGILTTVLIF